MMKKRRILVKILAIAFLIALPCAIHYRKARIRQACLNNLRKISLPLNCCIPMEHKYAVGAPIDPKLLPNYVLHGQIPKCPTGTEYKIQYVAGGRAVCPVHGDLLGTNFNGRCATATTKRRLGGTS